MGQRNRHSKRIGGMLIRTRACGNNTFIMAAICSLAAWPRPVTARLMKFGAYSCTGILRRAGTNRQTARGNREWRHRRD